MYRRPVRLDRDQRLHQIRPRVGDRPAKRTGLGMREQDRRADLVEERDQRGAVEFLLLGKAHDRRKLRRVELVERGIAGLSGPRPLRVQMRLRPQLETFWSDETLLGEIEARRLHRPVQLRPVRGTPRAT